MLLFQYHCGPSGYYLYKKMACMVIIEYFLFVRYCLEPSGIFFWCTLSFQWIIESPHLWPVRVLWSPCGLLGDGILEYLPPVYLLLHGAASDESINNYRLCLADTVRSVNCLVICGWIPAWINWGGREWTLYMFMVYSYNNYNIVLIPPLIQLFLCKKKVKKRIIVMNMLPGKTT